MIVFMYLLAIVLANLTVYFWGPSVSIINAFLLIGFILVARDKLHEDWTGDKLKMGGLIFLGGGISFIFGAGQIAVASFLSFVVSESVDYVVYHYSSGDKFNKSNKSNFFGAVADSILFPVLAFGLPVMWIIVVGQFIAKFFGGFLWSLIIYRMIKPKK